ncbi:MAG: iron-sulfur cluster co-chaperone HscB C-terminal domain-containing protein [Planctomycetota bacterium]
MVPEEDTCPFTILGLEPGFDVDPKDLRSRLRRFTRLVHPDFFALEGDEMLATAERNNALLNEAYETLADETRRANELLQRLGGPSEKDLGSMPQAFLMEVMEWNEVLEEAAPDSPELLRLQHELTEQRDRISAQVGAALSPLPQPGDESLAGIRQNLNARRYVDRALGRISAGPSPS